MTYVGSLWAETAISFLLLKAINSNDQTLRALAITWTEKKPESSILSDGALQRTVRWVMTPLVVIPRGTWGTPPGSRLPLPFGVSPGRRSVAPTEPSLRLWSTRPEVSYWGSADRRGGPLAVDGGGGHTSLSCTLQWPFTYLFVKYRFH